jgi:hypothetical protein
MIFILSSTLDLKPLQFFKLFSICSSIVGTICMALSGIYLMIIKPRQLRRKRLIEEGVDNIAEGFKGSKDENFKRKPGGYEYDCSIKNGIA